MVQLQVQQMLFALHAVKMLLLKTFMLLGSFMHLNQN